MILLCLNHFKNLKIFYRIFWVESILKNPFLQFTSFSGLKTASKYPIMTDLTYLDPVFDLFDTKID